MSCAFEGRAYKFQYAGIPDKYGCEGAISTNLDVSTVIKQTLYMETCLWITTWHMRVRNLQKGGGQKVQNLSVRIMMKKSQFPPLIHRRPSSFQCSDKSVMPCTACTLGEAVIQTSGESFL
ncbi:hypothetical protein T10_5719, partial [Trichinella papuae]